MYIPRDIDDRLKQWRHSPNRCPLILRGARQVGKSAALENFGKDFHSFVTFDFELNPELKAVFSGSLEPSHILMQLEAMAGKSIVPGETLVFFDEIQECPAAIAALRYFKEKMPNLHVVAAGSLLEFAIGEISFPVGRVEYEFMFPLSFSEFLLATGRARLIAFLPKPLESLSSPPTAMAKILRDALREYMVVGGMPEAVRVYSQSKSLIETGKIQDRIIRSFRDDIPKYVTGEMQKANISNLWLRIPKFSGQQIAYTKLNDDDPKRNKISLKRLQQAMLVHMVYGASPASLPLGANDSEKTFKPIFLDIGLAQRMCGRSPSDILNEKDLVSGMDGQLAEQFVGQQLLANSGGCEQGELYFWKRHVKSSSAEVDFLLARSGNIVPVEVKNGKAGSLKSLHLLLETYPSVKLALCIQNTDEISEVGKIRFAPLYSIL
jgi:predicted AAA+ superfamily ATPase